MLIKVAAIVLKDLNPDSATRLYQRARLSRALSLDERLLNMTLRFCDSRYASLRSGYRLNSISAL